MRMKSTVRGAVTALVVLLGMGAAGGTAGAQTCPGPAAGYEDFGDLNAAPSAVHVEDGWAYTAGVYGLAVYDVSDRTRPVKVGELELPEEAQAIDVAGGVAYVADGLGGLWIVDVSNPESPGTLASVPSDALSHDLVLSGSRVLLGDGVGGLRIVDVSDPAAPVVLGKVRPIGSVIGVAVEGDLAYLALGWGGFGIVDVSDPESPELLARVDDSVGYVGAVELSGDLLWAWDGALKAFDVSDPAVPRLLSTLDLGGITYEMFYRDGLLHLARWDQGLTLVDVSDPEHPTVTGTAVETFHADGVFVSGTTAYVAQRWRGLAVVDVSDPANPERVGWAGSPGQARDVALSAGVAWVADGPAGLVAVDVSDPASSRVVGQLPMDGEPIAVAVSGSRAFVGDGAGRLSVVDVGSPGSPVLLGSISLAGAITDVAVRGSTVFATAGSGGLHIVDVSDPDDPRLLASYRSSGAVYGVEVVGEYAFLAAWQEGLHVVDLGDLRNPRLVGHCDTRMFARGVAVSGDFAYVADRYGGIQVFDVADPLHPRPVAVVEGFFRDVEVRGGILYGVSEDFRPHTLVLADVSDPWHPFVFAEIPLRRFPEAVAVDETTATAWLPGGAFLEAVNLGCVTCAGLAATADPVEIVPGGSTTVTVTVVDLLGRPAAGRTVTGTASAGSLSAFTDNGDGTYTATYTAGDGPGWIPLAISVDGVPCTAETPVHVVLRDDITVTDLDEGLELTMIPASAHAGGREGTNWRTDVVLHNPGTRDASVALFFLEKGRDNGDAAGRVVTVRRQTSVALDDVVEDFFGRGDTAGAILVASDQPLQVTSRTYNDVPEGTFGQFIPGIPALGAVGQGEEVRLIQLTRNEDFRTNIGFANLADRQITLRVSLYDANGNSLGEKSFSVPAFGFYQKTDIFGSGAVVEDAWAVVRSDTPGAAFFAYGSVVDEHSGDPVLILPVASSSGQPLFVPAAAHVAGAAGTNWRTDLEVHNPGTETATFTVELLERDVSNTSPESESFSLEPGTSLRLADVLWEVFGFSGAAALRITPTSGTVMATSRTYNDVPGGTYGQFIPAVPGPPGEGVAAVGRVVQLSSSASDASGFRTNIGLLETGGQAVNVNLGLYNGEGVRLGEIALRLGPHESVQLNRVFREVTGETVGNGYAVVTTQYLNRKVLVYASVVDNLTGDPVYLPGE